MRLRLLLPLLITLAGPAGLSAAGQTPTDPPAPPPPAHTAKCAFAVAGLRVRAGRPARSVREPVQPQHRERGASGRHESRPTASAGIGIGELVLRGLVESRGGWLAMIGTPSGKTYSIRPGDRLFDGNVTAITADASS